MQARLTLIVLGFLFVGLSLVALGVWVRESGPIGEGLVVGKATVADRLLQYGAAARTRLAPDFERMGVGYPPKRVVFVGLKDERRLEVWVSEEGSGQGGFRHLRDYPIVAASGQAGPKLREGDRQVPEGLYRIELLNPNSLYHLSLRVNYPNEFDRAMARNEGRSNLGGDIMIHGSTGSVGCLAMGDQASEDLFVLAADTGIERIGVILTPVDFRVRGLPHDGRKLPKWTEELYRQVREELVRLTE